MLEGPKYRSTKAIEVSIPSKPQSNRRTLNALEDQRQMVHTKQWVLKTKKSVFLLCSHFGGGESVMMKEVSFWWGGKGGAFLNAIKE